MQDALDEVGYLTAKFDQVRTDSFIYLFILGKARTRCNYKPTQPLPNNVKRSGPSGSCTFLFNNYMTYNINFVKEKMSLSFAR